jgi:uncharacterized protein YdaU (DUF1376 family)
MHYYKRNLGDYAKKAGRLSMLQHGAYTLLIDACYDREQFPTLEEAIEWTWASTTEEEEAVKFVLKRFFVLKDNVYVQKRIEEEISEFHKKAETNKRIAVERETKRKNIDTVRMDDDNEPSPNHEPLTINQEPLTKNQEPETRNQKPVSLTPKPKNLPAAIASSDGKNVETLDLLQAGRDVWGSYSNAFFLRYQTEPVQNAKVRSIIKQFVQRIGVGEASHVAAFFVSHNDKFYIQKTHSVEQMLKDAEGLRTQWATGRSMTTSRATQLDRTASNHDSVTQAIEMMKRKNHASI